MDFVNVIVRFFQEGGPFMYPIAVVLAVGAAIAVERWLCLSKAGFRNRKAFNTLIPLVAKREFSTVLKSAQRSQVPVDKIIVAGVKKYAEAQAREDIESAMEEGLLEVLPRYEKRTAYLATLANIATLMGLLGTIIGLIAAFTAVANADPAEKATLLSQSISVAMNTTAFGLIAAIPLLIFHALLQSKTNQLVDNLEMAGIKCLNLIGGNKQKAPQA